MKQWQELDKELRRYINPETFSVAVRILQHKNKSDAETILNQVQHKVQHDIFGLYWAFQQQKKMRTN